MKVNCDLCRADDYRRLCRLDDFGAPFFIVRCNKCGLIYQNPRLEMEYVNSLYSQDYYEGKGKIIHNKDFKQDRMFSEERLKIIEKIKKPGRLLDIGCGIGAFLDVAHKRGWEAYGVDISAFAADEAKKIAGLKIFPGELKDIRFEAAFFDLITGFELIEHLDSPSQTLREAHRILKDDGLLIIQTANMDSLRIRMLQPEYYYLPIHLHYFTRETLVKMLEKTGFEAVRIYNGSEFSLAAELKLFKNEVPVWRLLLRKLLNKAACGRFTLNTTMVVYAGKR